MEENLALIAHENSNYVYRANGIKTYEELFVEVSKIAQSKGLVKNSYCSELLKRESSYPTGILASRGIAIPHTDSIHSNVNGLVTVITDSPITFKMMGSPEHDVYVEIIFFVLSNESEKHLQQLSQLMDLIQDKEFLDGLVEKKDNKFLTKLIYVS